MDRVEIAIARWAEVLPGLDTTGMEVVARILCAATLLEEQLARVLALHDLQPAEYSVLAILRSHGGSDAELPPKVLAEQAFFTTGGMTNLLKRLERDGLVTRRADPGDGRGVLMRLTEAGKARVESAVVAVSAAQRDALVGLSETGRTTLAKGLSALLDSLELHP